MPTSYSNVPMDLTDKQNKNLLSALSSSTPLTLRFTQEQIKNGEGNLLLTSRQMNHLDKSNVKGKGANLTLSATQLKKMKSDMKKGNGMYGVNHPPQMPRDAGIGSQSQTGAGVKEVVKKVGRTALKGAKVAGKVLKPIAKIGLKEGCKLATKAAAVKAGVNPDNPVVELAHKEACGALANTVLGDGAKRQRKKKNY